MKGTVLRRGLKLARERGPVALVTEALRRYVFDVRHFYLYKHHHSGQGTLTRTSAWSLEEFFVMDNATADQIAREREDFRVYSRNAEKALHGGAVAFCVYAGPQVAHVGWIATSAKSRRVLDRLGYDIRFDEGEAWTGAAYTSKRWRGQGLLVYSCQRRFEYLKACGIEFSRAAVEMSNIPSHRATMRFNPRIYACGRQVKVFSVLRWWSERPA